MLLAVWCVATPYAKAGFTNPAQQPPDSLQGNEFKIQKKWKKVQ